MAKKPVKKAPARLTVAAGVSARPKAGGRYRRVGGVLTRIQEPTRRPPNG